MKKLSLAFAMILFATDAMACQQWQCVRTSAGGQQCTCTRPDTAPFTPPVEQAPQWPYVNRPAVQCNPYVPNYVLGSCNQ